jgi:hypothetical protein
MHLYCTRSRFSKCQPFERSSIASGHGFQNACHMNAPLLHQVMLSKCLPFECTSIVSGHAFQNGGHLKAPP